MRAFGLGLAAAMIVAVFAGTAFAKDDIPADQRKAGMAAAPALITSAKLNCDLADARFMGEGSTKAKVYEIACKSAMGYIVVTDPKGAAPQTESCLVASMPDDKGKPNPMMCKLPGNLNPAAGFNSVLAQAGPSCSIEKGRPIGTTSTADVYEVLCTGGPDYVLYQSKTGAAPTAGLCITAGPGMCTLESAAAQAADVDRLAAGIGQPCTVKNRRYIGGNEAASFFEVACSEGKGYVLRIAPNGSVQQAIDCVKSSDDLACTLTDVRQAQTEQNSVYTHLAQKAGFDCTVSQYANFPMASDGSEVVELACSNRKDGGVGFFPANATPRVSDCVQAAAKGYVCKLSSDITPVYAKLQAGLKAFKASSECKVVGAQAFASTPTMDLIEFACAEPPGAVAEVATGTYKVMDMVPCSSPTITSNGGCSLPGNKK